ncbi:uncharacterized protein SPPG_04852 [Spizellomyces punctatus DAOM BR117]|uniref:C-CAP/cofactor C-like domain-containing protein n=1 Tax=Spizellomyces punctatus (strain DAOM BR117) TaxID=645134 RepID=A0A0L0HI83_SPIPD|nr:uncharacterized protein SPPG_04852 [Spizellomyces punctatus DAOM BR117]KND00544.1 hypothetical protein SPPG_04852 [Spizellomyces punctatus DAOM BR117]|eukprot:XP_016608583.1 hypothetical protein SPPG_04852 [Spizellomyces punctatus DAOM BR117]
MGFLKLPQWIQRAVEFLHLKSKQKEKRGQPEPACTSTQKIEKPIPEVPPPPPKYNAADFLFSKLVKQDVVKPPGSIPEGMPFNIEDCEDCSIHLFDRTAQVTIDACHRCFIFIAPCEGSVFIRDCRDCTVVVASQQFRLRDGHSLRISLYCATQPVIETSFGIRFSCFRYSYPRLRDQFRQAKLPLLRNEWSNVYDFNDSTGKNWSLEAPLEAEDYPRLPVDVQETVQVDVTHAGIVPLALGRPSRRSDEENRTMISFAPEDVTLHILWKLQDQVSITRIKERTYSAGDVNLLFGHVGDDRIKTVAGQKGNVCGPLGHEVLLQKKKARDGHGRMGLADARKLVSLDQCFVIEFECKALESVWALIGESMQDTSCVYISRDRETTVKDKEVFFGGQ